MKVFVSWSGPISRAVAVSLRKHLPLILQNLEVFMSKHDIRSGAKWMLELSEGLEESSFGILCLTESNLDSAWLLFEAGALAKHSSGRACGLLLNELPPSELAGPLAQLQHRAFKRDELLQLIQDINAELSAPREPNDVAALFEKFWPDLESEYLAGLATEGSGHPRSEAQRSERDLLEELLMRVREIGTVTASDPMSSGAGVNVLSRPVTYDSLAWYTLWKFPGKTVSEQIQAVLLRDLGEVTYPRVRDIDNAVSRAEPAVREYADLMPHLFRFGTDYITKSLGFVDPEFRARHGFAKRTLDAFEEYQALVRP